MHRLATFIILLCFALTSLAQNHTLRAVRVADEAGYNCWIYTPHQYDSTRQRTPVVIFLHGASLCGDNLDRVRRYGPLHAIDMGRTIDALVVVPQNPGGAWNAERLNRLLEWTKAHYALDSTRIYVAGMSLGAYGTLDFAAAYPHKIAAAMAICGGCSASEYSGLGQIPLWILHGTADRAVPLSHSKAIVDGLAAANQDSRLRYTWLKGANHSSPARIFYLPKTYEWLFAHSLADPQRPVNRDIEITHTDLPHAYEGMTRGAEKPTLITE